MLAFVPSKSNFVSSEISRSEKERLEKEDRSFFTLETLEDCLSFLGDITFDRFLVFTGSSDGPPMTSISLNSNTYLCQHERMGSQTIAYTAAVRIFGLLPVAEFHPLQNAAAA